jgi:formin-binding protein 1
VADSESSSTPALSRSSSRGEASDHIGSKISPLTCSQASSSVAPTASFFTQPSLLATPAELPVVRVIYDFTPTSPFELAVHGQSACIGSRCCPYALTSSDLEGASVRVIEDDDGSGWVKVVDEDGGRGLVPASYIESAEVTQVAGPVIEPSGQFGEW